MKKIVPVLFGVAIGLVIACVMWSGKTASHEIAAPTNGIPTQVVSSEPPVAAQTETVSPKNETEEQLNRIGLTTSNSVSVRVVQKNK